MDIVDQGGTQRLTTRSIAIAAGARPFRATVARAREVGYVTSDTLWAEFAKLDTPPARLVVLGVVRLAQSFAGSKGPHTNPRCPHAS